MGGVHEKFKLSIQKNFALNPGRGWPTGWRVAALHPVGHPLSPSPLHQPLPISPMLQFSLLRLPLRCIYEVPISGTWHCTGNLNQAGVDLVKGMSGRSSCHRRECFIQNICRLGATSKIEHLMHNSSLFLWILRFTIYYVLGILNGYNVHIPS